MSISRILAEAEADKHLFWLSGGHELRAVPSSQDAVLPSTFDATPKEAAPTP